ncbi:hypothetical protein ACFLU6_01160, partial [Acidobacteriota bacterium]
GLNMSKVEEKGAKFWIKSVIVPLIIALIALVPVFFGFYAGKLKYKRTLLPVQPNPSVSLEGRWMTEYADVDALRPQFAAASPFSEESAATDVVFHKATIEVDVEGPTFTATAWSEHRIWKIEGYIDGDSILYVYKDKYHPNSFGSAFLRKHGSQAGYIGVWAGRSPDFSIGGQQTLENPFLVRGWVRWKPID